MKVKDLIPWDLGKHEAEQPREAAHPIRALQSDINRAFEDFWQTFNFPTTRLWDSGFTAAAVPSVDVRDTEKEVEVIAELPGMEEKDVEVTVAEGALVISGAKKYEQEKQDKGYLLRERSFGRVERVVPLPDGLDLDSAKATFKNGVLTVAIPKTKEAQAAVKRIAVKAG